MLLVQLNNAELGTLLLNKVDPKGLSEIELILKRGDENDGIVYEVTLDLDFFKDAKAFIQTVFEGQGPGGVISVVIFEYNPNTKTWSSVYTGQIKLDNYTVTETYVTTNLEQTGFEVQLANLIDVNVDLETLLSQGGVTLPATPTKTIELHSKTIQRVYLKDGLESANATGIDSGNYWILFDSGKGSTTANVFRDEIKNRFNYPNQLEKSTSSPFVQAKKYWWKVEEPGSYQFQFNASYLYQLAGLPLANWYIRFHLVYGQDGSYTDINLIGTQSLNNSGEILGDLVATHTIDLIAGDEVYFYGYVGISVSGTHDGLFAILSKDFNAGEYLLTVTADTTIQANTAKHILIYEAFEKLAQYITDQTDAFKSDVLGRTDIDYDEDGEASLIGVTTGGLIRKLDKKIFTTFSDLFNAVSSPFCLGFGVETIDGVRKIVVEKKEHFYNKNLMVVEIPKVSNLQKKNISGRYYSEVIYNAPKIEALQINGIDEHNTKRTLKAPVSFTKSKLELLQPYRTSGYEIESQRRKINSTEDAKLDDENFLVCLVRDGSDFISERNENFPTVTGLIDPDTAYNLNLSPMQNIKRWAKILASNVARQADKVFSFGSGEGNYEVTTQRTGEDAVAENAGIDVSESEPLWYAEEYTFESVIRRNQWELLRQFPYGFIRFTDNAGNKQDGYLLEARRNVIANKATWRLLKVFRGEIVIEPDKIINYIITLDDKHAAQVWAWAVGGSTGNINTNDLPINAFLTLSNATTILATIGKTSNGGIALGPGTVKFLKNGTTEQNNSFEVDDDVSDYSHTFNNLVTGDVIRIDVVENVEPLYLSVITSTISSSTQWRVEFSYTGKINVIINDGSETETSTRIENGTGQLNVSVTKLDNGGEALDIGYIQFFVNGVEVPSSIELFNGGDLVQNITRFLTGLQPGDEISITIQEG